MLTRTQKEDQVSELKDKFGRATSVYVADYRGLDVEAVNALRRRVRSEGEGEYEYRVTKNTVLRRAVEGSDAAGLSEHFQGPTAVALSYGDPVGLAKILEEFAKDHEVFELKGGIVDGAAVTRDEIATLATLPSLDELRGKLVGLLQAPATKLVRLLNEPGAQLARLLDARCRQDSAREEGVS
jgi:large subunit ribosomal protein L10